jgi:molybdopterin/thiamine biosynthesis adenylyltransferase
MTVVGLNHRRLYPAPRKSSTIADNIYHRQSLLFGARGQEILKAAKIGIIGMGGVGSLVSEWAARLGVGEIVAIDYDKLEPSNNSRVVGATRWDAPEFLLNSRFAVLRGLGKRLSTHKVHIGRRVARIANPRIRYHPVVGNVVDERDALKLKDADFIFLCADSAQSRLVFNALVHQYLIPGVQIGTKVSVDKATGDILDIFCVSRPVLPQANGGCLWCNQLISPAKLQEEAISDEQRKRQAYVDDSGVHAPSVITLNALGAAQAVNEFLFAMVGLHDDEGQQAGYRMASPRGRAWAKVKCDSRPTCLHCGDGKNSALGKGDRTALPCRT